MASAINGKFFNIDKKTSKKKKNKNFYNSNSSKKKTIFNKVFLKVFLSLKYPKFENVSSFNTSIP